ncbi:hypothetical protein [Saccharophagus degradans]|uniref:Uncharacterized protein n=1 Tax=Saccharophagus degradans (strain 2-40 / ATCC 43961 / DSM 17024) TaxID=203122 RepID=Q21EK7_SACD2|nr:hypothetical protein [Saccharophagus degradans]ABD82872.1 hypothetical protein Sde_3617 [Saccharophagus degradans 2-40]
MNTKYLLIRLTLLVFAGCGLAYANPDTTTSLKRFESEEVAIEQAEKAQSIIYKINSLAHQLYLEKLKATDIFIEDNPVFGGRTDYVHEILGELEDTRERGGSSDSMDKGAIVQRIGDYLIMLRHGHLYSIHVEKKLEKADSLRLKLGEVGQGTLFNKLFISNNTLIIVGKNNTKKQSEYVFVEFSDNGSFKRKKTYFVEEKVRCSTIRVSYIQCYSSASSQRVIDNKLIIINKNNPYLPVESGNESSVFNLQVTKVDENGAIISRSLLFDRNEIYSSIVDGKYLSIHFLAECSIDQEEFRCSGKTILGGNLDESYITQDAAYFWVSGHRWSPDLSKIKEEDIRYLASSQYGHAAITRSVLYQMPLGDQPVSAIKLTGSPLGGEAFKGTNTHLYFVALYNPNRLRVDFYNNSPGESRFISIPRKLFEPEKIIELPTEHYSRLSYDHHGNKIAIFHDNYVFFSSYIGRTQSSLKVTSIENPTEIRSTVINANFIQLYPLGQGIAVFAYNNQTETNFILTVKLGSDWGKHDELIFPKYIGESERRTIIKAGNYLTNKNGSILTVARTAREDESYSIEGITFEKDDITNMSYIWISPDLNLNLMANVEGKEEIKWNLSPCDGSCLSWDFLSRAIFWENRIFSLLKFEVIEGVRKGNEIEELQRIDIRYD